MKNKTGFFFHKDYLLHDTGSSHPERPERLMALMENLNFNAFGDRVERITPEPALALTLELVHPKSHIDYVRNACRSNGSSRLDPDTVVSSDSFNASLLATGAIIEGCELVTTGALKNAFCAIRPPGHHAEPKRAMGFCLFNHVAVAARWLQEKRSFKKIAIIDWDVHHGNGSQAAFYDDPTVLYISMHEAPLYPGTGGSDETGVGEGLGTTLNIPLKSGSDDEVYLAAFAEQVETKTLDFEPDFLLISAGFDAHYLDPLANMKVTENGFAELTKRAVHLADTCCDGRLVSLLEGGYDLKGLSASVEAHIDALCAK